MDFIEFSAKTVNDAITEACQKFVVTSDKLEYEVVEEGSSGFLGIGSKPAVIRAKVKSSIQDIARDFLKSVFEAMNLVVVIDINYDEVNNSMNIDLSGDEMGVLIGKRGQTLDSLQYLVSLVVNKDVENYIHVKVDTENYRQRRKETLENLAKNISYKVKRTKRPVSLEPMNPYERRIIHAALADSEEVTTKSEGKEPERFVIIVPKNMKHRDGNGRNDNKRNRNGRDGRSNGKFGERKPYPKRELPTEETPQTSGTSYKKGGYNGFFGTYLGKDDEEATVPDNSEE